MTIAETIALWPYSRLTWYSSKIEIGGSRFLGGFSVAIKVGNISHEYTGVRQTGISACLLGNTRSRVLRVCLVGRR